MENNQIVETIKQVLQTEFKIPPSKLKPDTHLFKDLGLDSIDAIDMVVKMEVETGYKFTSEELKGIRTFQDVVNVVSNKLNGKNRVLKK